MDFCPDNQMSECQQVLYAICGGDTQDDTAPRSLASSVVDVENERGSGLVEPSLSGARYPQPVPPQQTVPSLQPGSPPSAHTALLPGAGNNSRSTKRDLCFQCNTSIDL